ncbi:sigma-70 family RNA polymerase sigma factor, partial [Streptomyces sp. UNOC14_S4]|uniref:sigma-70 family RNA polymerase sigma factor n=1 Tax=Streptomyces sp. UNOC14_S4 TaxID=2872340 RepID=UPI001E630B0D
MGVDGRDETRESERAGSPPPRRLPGRGGATGPGVPQQREGRDGRDPGESGGTSALPARPRPSHVRRSEPWSAPDAPPGTPPPDDSPSEEPLQEERTGDAPPSDIELVTRMRAGQSEAYEELYRRHAPAVRRYARSCCRDPHTAEDLTNEVFASTLQAVRGGGGPNAAVRAYLLTTVRRVAAAWAKTTRREQLVEDFAAFAASASRAARGTPDSEGAGPGADVLAMREAEQSLAVQAFRSLPARWQTVLWHTTVEEESLSEVAPLLGLTANAAAVLAHRAREGLKQAYLQAHVSAALTSGGSCARYADRLGAFARGGLRTRAERGLRKHLEECEKCRTAAVEVADVNTRLRALLPVAVIGWSAASLSAKAATGLVAGATAGAGAGAAATATAGSTASSGATGAAGAATGGTASTAGAGTAAGAAGGTAGGTTSSTGAAGAGAAGGSGTSGGTGTSGGAAASEGLGASAKVGIAVGAAVVASGVAAYALMGGTSGHHRAHRVTAGPVAPAPAPRATPSTAPVPKHRHAHVPKSAPKPIAHVAPVSSAPPASPPPPPPSPREAAPTPPPPTPKPKPPFTPPP